MPDKEILLTAKSAIKITVNKQLIESDPFLNQSSFIKFNWLYENKAIFYSHQNVIQRCLHTITS